MNRQEASDLVAATARSKWNQWTDTFGFTRWHCEYSWSRGTLRRARYFIRKFYSSFNSFEKEKNNF